MSILIKMKNSPNEQVEHQLADPEQLQRLGFSRLAADSYLSLSKLGPVPVSRLAADTDNHASNLYPALKWLEERGFINRLKTELGPTYVSAVKLEDALDDFFHYQKQQVLPIIRAQRGRSGSQ